jgi:hypothetical protein
VYCELSALWAVELTPCSVRTLTQARSPMGVFTVSGPSVSTFRVRPGSGGVRLFTALSPRRIVCWTGLPAGSSSATR